MTNGNKIYNQQIANYNIPYNFYRQTSNYIDEFKILTAV